MDSPPALTRVSALKESELPRAVRPKMTIFSRFDSRESVPLACLREVNRMPVIFPTDRAEVPYCQLAVPLNLKQKGCHETCIVSRKAEFGVIALKVLEGKQKRSVVML